MSAAREAPNASEAPTHARPSSALTPHVLQALAPGPELAAAPALLAHPDIAARGNGPARRAALLQLQRTHGNRAGQRVAGAAAPLVVQRARLNLRANHTISGVSQWPHRPPSNMRGSQGQHLTAYVAFEDAILSHVKDRTVPQAAAALIALLQEIVALPTMAAQPAHLMNAIGVNIQLLTNHANDADMVGGVIDNILAIRNQVPGTAEAGTGGGHGEAGNSGTLETVESALRRNAWPQAWDEDVVENQARYSMWRLLDYDPPPPTDGAAVQVIATRVLTHFLSLRMAYPHTFRWLTDRESYLFTYLLAHRADVGMPLPRLRDTQIDNQIRPIVYAGL